MIREHVSQEEVERLIGDLESVNSDCMFWRLLVETYLEGVMTETEMRARVYEFNLRKLNRRVA